MNLLIGFGVYIWMTTLILSLIILKFGSIRNISHAMLLLLNTALFIWGSGWMMAGLSRDPATAFFWWRYAFFGAIGTTAFFLHHVMAITNDKRKAPLIISYGITALLEVLLLKDLLSYRPIFIFDCYYVTSTGLGHPFLAIAWSSIGFYAVFVLYKAYKCSSGKEKTQLKLLLWGLGLCFFGGVSHFFTAFNPSIPPLGAIFVPMLPLVMTYGILKHRLLNIEIIVKRTLVFAGLLASVFAILILPTLILQEYLVRNAALSTRLIGLTVSGIIIIFTMRRIERSLIDITDKYLFQKKYDYKELLKTFTSEVLTVLDLDKLMHLTIDKLVTIIRIDSCAIFLPDEEKGAFAIAASYNFKDPAVLLRQGDAIFSNTGSQLTIPIRTHHETVGFLVLGKKKSDYDYTDDDLDILLPLARALGVAISNARLFARIRTTQIEIGRKEKMATLGTLAAGMAHEMRNPITTMKVFTEYLPDKIGEEEFRDKYRNIVVKEVDKIDHVIQTLIDFSGEGGDAEEDAASLLEAVDELISLTGVNADIATRIEFVRDIPESLPLLRVNRRELDEILLNVTQNAIQAIEGRGTVSFTARQKDEVVEIEIRDTGKGMPEEIVKHITSPFFTTKAEGYGLGLFVVDRLVKRNRGTIAVQSQLGAGTVFRMMFQCT